MGYQGKDVTMRLLPRVLIAVSLILRAVCFLFTLVFFVMHVTGPAEYQRYCVTAMFMNVLGMVGFHILYRLVKEHSG